MPLQLKINRTIQQAVVMGKVGRERETEREREREREKEIERLGSKKRSAGVCLS